MAMLNHVALAGGRITTSLTALKLGSSTLEVGTLVAIFAVMPMLLSVHAGRWIDHVGARRPLVIGSTLLCLGALLPFLFQTRSALLAAAFSISIGFMLNQMAVQDLLGTADPTRRLRNFSWLALSQSVSGFSGPLIAGLSLDHLGSRMAFGLLALAPLASAAGLYLLRRPLRDTNAALSSGGLRSRAGKQGKMLELLATPTLRQVLLVNTLLSSAWDTHLFVVPIYGTQIGLSATTIGVILAAFSAATFVIRLFLPMIQKHVQPWNLVRATIITTATDFSIYPFFSESTTLAGLSFVLGLALGSCQPSMLSLLHHHAPPGRAAEASGLRLAFISTSQVCLPLTFGALGAVIGIMPLFWAYAACMALGGWANRRPPQPATLLTSATPS